MLILPDFTITAWRAAALIRASPFSSKPVVPMTWTMRAFLGFSIYAVGLGWHVFFRNRDHGGAQQPFPDGEAGLHHIHDRTGGLAVAGHFRNRLMQVGIELAIAGVHRFHAIALQGLH